MGLLNPLVVYISAVQRSDVNEQVAVVVAADLGVPSGYGDVVEKDIAVGMPSDGDYRAIEPVPGTGFGPGPKDEKSGLFGGHCSRIGTLASLVRGMGLDDADGVGDLVRLERERRAAGRAVVGVVRVGVATVVADSQNKPFALPGSTGWHNALSLLDESAVALLVEQGSGADGTGDLADPSFAVGVFVDELGPVVEGFVNLGNGAG